jgi:hypothetical protein
MLDDMFKAYDPFWNLPPKGCFWPTEDLFTKYIDMTCGDWVPSQEELESESWQAPAVGTTLFAPLIEKAGYTNITTVFGNTSAFTKFDLGQSLSISGLMSTMLLAQQVTSEVNIQAGVAADVGAAGQKKCPGGQVTCPSGQTCLNETI